MNSSDTKIVRELAQRYRAACDEDVQDERRALWRRHNSLKDTRPLIYVRAFAWGEMPQAQCRCEDPFLRGHEAWLRRRLFWHGLRDDSVFEPWVVVPAAYRCTGWGVDGTRRHSGDPRGAFKVDYPIKTLEDVDKLRAPWHEIDEEDTERRRSRTEDVLGDILEVSVDRGPAYRVWAADISTFLGYLRGIEHFMLDMVDNPEWLHRLVAFMRDGVLRVHEQAEQAGDWGLCNHENQAMPYAEELPDPAANVRGVKRRQLWGYMAAQEMTGISPQMHEEFVLRYQLPILREFGLVAYGCCEDLTHKIDMLRAVPNLRRIAVSPFADVARCAEQIGRDYVVSYRPSPADMVSYGLNDERVTGILTRDLKACRTCHVDITLKDVETVEGDPDRVRRWVELARRAIDDVW